MPALQAVYYQVVKASITQTIRSFKEQWEDLLASVRAVQWQPAFAGIGPVSRAGVQETAKEAASSVRFSMSEVGGEVGKGTGDAAYKGTSKTLLPGEGKVGTYEELIDAGSRGDNITPHHMPSVKYMKTNAGVHKNDGVSMNMEHPHPSTGGRHCQTATYGMTG
jgi:hypothetical protein